MSKRKQKKNTQPNSTTKSSSEHLRRLLLTLVAMLIVARPLVPGEDPAQLSEFSSGANLFISCLWLIVATGWAYWWYRSGDRSWRAGLMEAALLATVILVFVSANQAEYKYAAWLVAWEWIILFVAFFLVQQLVRTDFDRRGILAIFLANAVSLSAFAMFQYGIARPQRVHEIEKWEQQIDKNRQELQKRERVVGALGGIPALPLTVLLTGDQEGSLRTQAQQLHQQKQQLIEQNHVRATYDWPSSFAGYLVLILPSLGMAVLVFWRQHRRSLKTGIAFLCLLLCLVALWLTHSRGAFLALMVVTALALIYSFRHELWKRKGLIVGGVAILVALGIGAIWLQPDSLDHPRGSIKGRLDFWEASWGMIQENVWLGVGPGNFPRHYLQHKPVRAADHVTEPHNFILETWATLGIFAVVTLLIVFVTYFVRQRNISKLSEEPLTEKEPLEKSKSRWEFYSAGMAGLLLGYLLQEMTLSPGEAAQPWSNPDSNAFLIFAGIACIRSMIWFATFAIFERIPWSPRQMAQALALGALALILTLLVSGGISFPSVAQPLWIVLGLSVAMVYSQRQSEPLAHPPFARLMLLPVVGGVALAFLMYVLMPVTRSNSKAVRAMQAVREYRQNAQSKLPTVQKKVSFMYNTVAKPLSEAVFEEGSKESNTGNSLRRLQLSRAYREVWMLALNTEVADATLQHYLRSAVFSSYGARQLDPRNVEAYVQESELHFLAALSGMGDEKAQKTQLELGIEMLEKAAELDPTNPQIHYRLAQVLYQTGLYTKAKKQAEIAFDLSRNAPKNRRLSESQQREAQQWIR